MVELHASHDQVMREGLGVLTSCGRSAIGADHRATLAIQLIKTRYSCLSFL